MMMRPFGSIALSMLYAFSTLIAGAAPLNAPTQASAAAAPAAYTPEAPCQITPGLLPAGWPASPPYQPFSQTFTSFLNATIHALPNAAPIPLTVSQVSPPQVTTPRKLDLGFQLHYNQQYPGPTIRVTSDLAQ